MKSVIRSIGVASAILMLVSVQNAGAQIVDSVDFTTSFPFTVGNTTVPAGSYTVTADEDSPDILELTGGRTAVLFQTVRAISRTTPAKTEVVFKRYGDAYVLKNIWTEGETGGVETLAAEGERHTAKHAAQATEQRVPGRKRPHASTPSSTTSQR